MRRAVLAGLLVVVTSAACGGSNGSEITSPTPTATHSSTSSSTSSAPSSANGAFDPCSLLATADLVEFGLPEDVRISFRRLNARFLECGYSTSPLIGNDGEQITRKSDVQAALKVSKGQDEYMPDRLGYDVKKLPGVGDRAVVIDQPAVTPPIASVLVGDRMIEFHFKAPTSGELPLDRLSRLLRKAVDRLPATITMEERDLRGRCANLDLAKAARAGLRTDIARTTEGQNGDVACTFVDYEIRMLSGPSAVKAFQEFVKGARDGKAISGVREENRFTAWAEEDADRGNFEAWIRSGEQVVQLSGSFAGDDVGLDLSALRAGKVPADLLSFLQTLPDLLR